MSRASLVAVIAIAIVILASLTFLSFQYAQNISNQKQTVFVGWPLYFGDPQNSGRSTNNGPQSAYFIWSIHIGSYIGYPILIGSDGSVYVVANGSLSLKIGTLVALSAVDGSIEWSRTFSRIDTVLIGSNDTIFVSQDGPLPSLSTALPSAQSTLGMEL